MSIDNAFDNLVEEFSNLQVQVSELRKERTVLLETLDNLRNESLHSVKLPSNSADLEVQENDSFEDTIPAIKLNSVEENAVYTDDEDPLHPVLVKSRTKREHGDESMEQSNHSIQENVKVKVAKMTMIQKFWDKGSRHMTYTCEECGYASPRKSMVRRHWDSVHNKGMKKYKCQHCTYSAAQTGQLKSHMITVHKMGDIFKCEKCPYSSTRGDMLKRHWDALHNMGNKRFKCEECPFSSAEKQRLKEHIVSVHNNMGENCDKCPYSSVDKEWLNTHKKSHHAKEE